ncbi:MAG: hypothetical protein Q4D02_06620 [Clostridia bacterium]|nr:hypothetical protein [Clostridia bacterium]
MKTNVELIRVLHDPALLEILSDLEHKRWASWQKYVHEKCTKNADGSLTIPKDSVDWWESEINADYKDLNERQKESDREQVRPVLKQIEDFLTEKLQ